MEDDLIEVPDSEKTPVTIVTGFLGSGKTTLVNYILKSQNEWRICVIENEFGEVNIDEGLVSENIAAKEDIVSMDNGCVCCSVRGDLVRTLNTLISRRRDFQAILLETTGLADPAPIITTFNSDATIQDNYRIDSIVTLVDCKHVQQHLHEVKPDDAVNEAVQQVAFADRIMLNKIDLVSPTELQEVKDEILSINHTATLIETQRSVIDLGKILNQSAFNLEHTLELDPDILIDDSEEEEEAECNDAACTEDHSHGAHAHGHENVANGHDHGHAHGENADKETPPAENCTEEHDHSGHEHGHQHTTEPKKKRRRKKKKHDLSQVSSVGMKFPGSMQVDKFNMFMSTLLQAKAADLYRSKGVLSFKGQGNTKFVFQGVHENINFGPSSKPWGDDEERVSTMVFIGRNLNKEELKAGLKACLAAE